MKNLFSLIVGGAVGFAAAYFLVSKPAENCKPAAAAVAPASVQAVASAVTPADDLQKLSVLNPTGTKDPARVIRQIVHHMESLVDAGNKAIDPISQVIGTGKDLDYLLDERAGAASSLPFWNWRAGQSIVSGLVLPPSFRLGLVDVLKSIGTEEAQNVMAMMMNNTSRAVEVAYIAQVLEKLSPGLYSEIAMAAARRILAAPAATSTSPLDANGNAYLYAMLNAHGDTTLVATAQSNLVSNARLDVDAANYLLTALKEKALPQLATTYQGANSEDKNRIAMMTFNYVGSSAEANQIFKDWILNSGQDANSQTVVARPRSLYLQMLCGGNFGPYHAEVPTNRDLINSRIGLLKEMDTASTDLRLKQAIGQSLQCLQAR